MDPDDPLARHHLIEHQARVATLIQRFLPYGFRYGHELCYPVESDAFVPSVEKLDELLGTYAELLKLIDPKPHDLNCYGFLACMEMMDFNELIIGYLNRAELIPARAEICPLLDASIRNLQTVYDGEYHDDDSGKRFYRMRNILCAR